MSTNRKSEADYDKAINLQLFNFKLRYNER
jgi:hypothetical protein